MGRIMVSFRPLVLRSPISATMVGAAHRRPVAHGAPLPLLRYLRNAVLLLVIMCCYSCQPSQAKNTVYKAYIDAATKAFQQQKYVDAEKLARSAVEQVETSGDSTELCESQALLGAALHKEGKNAEAVPLLKRALTMAENLKMRKDYVCGLLDILGFVYAEQGMLFEAQPLQEKSLQIRESIFRNKPQAIKSNLVNLASLYLRMGKYKEAETLYQRAVELYEKQPGIRNADLGTVLSNCGYVLYALGKYEDAERMLQRSLKAYQEGGSENTLDGSAPLTHLGLIYVQQGKLANAEPLFRRSLALTQAAVGEDNVRTAIDKRNISLLLRKQGKHQEAEKYARDALALARKHLGAEHSNTGVAMVEVADCLRGQGKAAEAEPLADEGIQILQRKLGSDHGYLSDALVIRAELCKALGRQSDAATQYQRALQILENAIGTDNQRYTALKQRAAEFEAASPQVASVRSPEHASRESNRPPSGSAEAPRVISQPIADKWALVVGISHFSDPRLNLHYAAKDAQDFADFLVKEEGFAPDHVKVLLNEAASRENILAAVGDKWLPRVCAPEDLVVIYISSHGSASSMDIGGLNYVVAHNTDKDSLYATGIPLQELTRMVKERVHSERVLLVLDACHSGAASVASKSLIRVGNFDAEQLAQGTGQLVLCSSSPNQVSWESRHYNNGVFTRRLIEGLRQKGRHTTLAEAYAYLKEQVQQEVLRDRGELQTPVIKSMWHGEDLKLGVTPVKPRPGMAFELGSIRRVPTGSYHQGATKSFTPRGRLP